MMSMLNAQLQEGAVPSPPEVWNGAKRMGNTRQHDNTTLSVGFGGVGVCFSCTKPLTGYDIKTTEGKEGPGTVC